MMSYVPHKFQREFHKSPARFRSIFAGRRGGKSLAGSVEALWHADKGRTNGLIVAPTYEFLVDVNIPMVMDMVPEKSILSWNKVEKRLILVNNSQIIFRSADTSDKVGRGMSLDWTWFDEAEYMRYGRQAWESVYPALTDRRGIAWATTTPQGFGWAREVFYEPAVKGNSDYATWRYRTIDNPHIDPEIVEKARAELDERVYRQEYLASFEKFTGLVYRDFDYKVHVIEPKELDRDDLYFIGIDVGYNNPTAVLLIAEDKDGNLYVVDEWYEAEKTATEVASAIHEMVGDKRIEDYIIDPASAGTHQTSQTSILTQLQESGIPCMPGNNDIRAGIDRVIQRLKPNKEGNAQLYIFSTCTNIIREFEQYSWPKKKTENSNLSERPEKKFDHALDALRYVVMNRPEDFERVQRDKWGRVIPDMEGEEEEFIDERDPWEVVL